MEVKENEVVLHGGSISTDAFPYARSFLDETKAKAAYEALKKYRIDVQVSQEQYVVSNVQIDCRWVSNPFETNRYVVIPVSDGAYYKMNFLTDWFTEVARVRARRYHHDSSPYDFWAHPVTQSCLQYCVSLQHQREWLYKQMVEASNYRLDFAAVLLDTFRPKSIFDPCAGHGDRAIAAYSRLYVQKYHACDPNELGVELIRGAIRQLQTWDMASSHELEERDYILRRNFAIHSCPVEDWLSTPANEEEQYDMIWTCPPYFDTEIYCDKPTQSIKRFPDKNEWYTKWLLPMLQNSWKHLKDDGVLVLSINNVKDHSKKQTRSHEPVSLRFDMTERLVDDLKSTLPRNQYLGVVSYKDGTRYEPTFVWKKSKRVDHHVQNIMLVSKPFTEASAKRDYSVRTTIPDAEAEPAWFTEAFAKLLDISQRQLALIQQQDKVISELQQGMRELLQATSKK